MTLVQVTLYLNIETPGQPFVTRTPNIEVSHSHNYVVVYLLAALPTDSPWGPELQITVFCPCIYAKSTYLEIFQDRLAFKDIMDSSCAELLQAWNKKI